LPSVIKDPKTVAYKTVNIARSVYPILYAWSNFTTFSFNWEEQEENYLGYVKPVCTDIQYIFINGYCYDAMSTMYFYNIISH